MNVDEDYLNRFATQVRGKPAEVTLNGYEASGTHVTSIDDPDGTYLSVRYADEYESPYDAVVGADKRSTFVVAKRGADAVGAVGFRFAGLIKLDDLRTWYRKHYVETDGSV